MAIDFTTALARLLQDGLLRDKFFSDPHGTLQDMDVEGRHKAPLLGLNSPDLERQAEVLLRKRFSKVGTHLRVTCARLGDRAWPAFRHYARHHWPPPEESGALDAYSFLQSLSPADAPRAFPLEANRLDFHANGRHLAIHFLRSKLPDARFTPAVQMLIRFPGGRWHELLNSLFR